MKRNGEIHIPPVGCKIEGCEEKHQAKGYCKKHYGQLYISGNVTKRFKSDPNDFIIHDDCCEIKLYYRNREYKASAFIDLQDVEKCKQHKWYLNTHWTSKYVETLINKKNVTLHRFLLGDPPDGYIYDHIDRNSLNNRRSNLRLATRQQNGCNVAPYKNKSSRYKGVSKQKNRWKACIRNYGELNYLGLFKTEEEAMIAYNNKAKELHGEFAYLNVVNG
jgi:hypothetical protein